MSETRGRVLASIVAVGLAGFLGTDGENATVSIGTVNTGSAGCSATVTKGDTNTNNAVLNFQIPRGVDGTNGQNASVNIHRNRDCWSVWNDRSEHKLRHGTERDAEFRHP